METINAWYWKSRELLSVSEVMTIWCESTLTTVYKHYTNRKPQATKSQICGAQSQWIHQQNTLTLKAKRPLWKRGNKDCKIPRRWRNKNVFPNNARNNTHKVSLSWQSKCDLSKDVTNGHAKVDWKNLWGLIITHRITGSWRKLRMGEVVFPRKRMPISSSKSNGQP